ncbi:MAG: FecR family protein, partial [Rhodanobacteraceae bacterium]
MNIQRRININLWRAALTLVCASGIGIASADPPDRVARLGYMEGNVSFQPAGESEWVEAQLNRPLTTGDQIYTDRNARAELEIGDATVRLDSDSTFNLLELDDSIAQIELTHGVLNLDVHHVFEGQSYEIDTPTLAFVVNREGEYRIDIAPNGDSTMVTVFDGAGDVYGENDASYSVDAGYSYRFHDSALHDYEVLDLPRADDFDSWCDAREHRYEQSPSRRYVSSDVIGYQDLDNYGAWDTVDTYGSVWFPTRVEAGWAPYSSGHWVWIDPWGWSWIDSAPWGFAPFHYGRWAYVRNRWGWIPGPRNVRAIYAPALVGFIGGGNFSVSISGGGPVGWFPLGPRDVYVPWYHGSRNYFRDINMRNTTVINNVNITNIYNNYSNGRPIRNVSYAYRNDVRAVTAVPRAAFVGGGSVRSQRIQVNQAELSRSHDVGRIAIAPIAASAVAANATRARAVPQRAVLDRRIIARRAPPAKLAP